MQALVIGASGQIGGAICRLLGARGARVTGTYRSRPLSGCVPLDITDPAAVRACVAAAAPDTIFVAHNLSGGVDHCEAHPEQARLVLGRGLAPLLEAAARLDARAVLFSSDYIFDGRGGPYDEEAAPCPINAYGRAKLESEELLRSYSRPHLIVRTTAVFSWTPGTRNFAMQVWESLQAGRRFKAAQDQWCNPTLAEHLAEATIALLDAGQEGTFNVAGRDRMPRSDMAAALARALDLDAGLIEPLATSALGQRAARPLQGGLRTDKLRRAGIESPSLEQALRMFRSRKDSTS